MSCTFFPDEFVSRWMWVDPITGNETFGLPQCWPQCKHKPPSEPGIPRNWSNMASIFVSVVVMMITICSFSIIYNSIGWIQSQSTGAKTMKSSMLKKTGA